MIWSIDSSKTGTREWLRSVISSRTAERSFVNSIASMSVRGVMTLATVVCPKETAFCSSVAATGSMSPSRRMSSIEWMSSSPVSSSRRLAPDRRRTTSSTNPTAASSGPTTTSVIRMNGRLVAIVA